MRNRADPKRLFNELLSGVSFGAAGADFFAILQWAGDSRIHVIYQFELIAALPFLVLAGAIPAYHNAEGAAPRNFNVSHAALTVGLCLFGGGFSGSISRLINPFAAVVFGVALMIAIWGFVYGRRSF